MNVTGHVIGHVISHVTSVGHVWYVIMRLLIEHIAKKIPSNFLWRVYLLWVMLKSKILSGIFIF